MIFFLKFLGSPKISSRWKASTLPKMYHAIQSQSQWGKSSVLKEILPVRIILISHQGWKVFCQQSASVYFDSIHYLENDIWTIVCQLWNFYQLSYITYIHTYITVDMLIWWSLLLLSILNILNILNMSSANFTVKFPNVNNNFVFFPPPTVYAVCSVHHNLWLF